MDGAARIVTSGSQKNTSFLPECCARCAPTDRGYWAGRQRVAALPLTELPSALPAVPSMCCAVLCCQCSPPAAELAVGAPHTTAQWGERGRALGRRAVLSSTTNVCLFMLYWNLYLKVTYMENILLHVAPLLSRMSLITVQCLSASVNNKWRTIIQYVAKSLSVSPGRTLMGAAGLQIHEVTSQNEAFLAAPLCQQQLV